MVGSSVMSTESGLAIIGGGATCFPSGTHWETRSFKLLPMLAENEANSYEKGDRSLIFRHLVSRKVIQQSPEHFVGTLKVAEVLPKISRVSLNSADDFLEVLKRREPVIIENLSLGPCTSKWTADYLVESIGNKEKVC